MGLLLFQVFVVGGFHIGDVQEAVAPHAEIDEGGLNARLDIDDAPLVDVAHVAFSACALHVKLFEDAVLEDGDADFLWLEAVDQHFFLHVFPFVACAS